MRKNKSLLLLVSIVFLVIVFKLIFNSAPQYLETLNSSPDISKEQILELESVRVDIISDVIWKVILVFIAITLALIFPYIDYLIYAFYLHPNEPVSHQVQELFSRRHFVKMFQTMDSEHSNFNKLTINSVHFQALLIFLGLYIILTYSQIFGLAFLSTLIIVLSFRLNKFKFLSHNWFWIYKGQVTERFISFWVALNIFFAIAYSLFI